jgi:hypothetical protein
MRKAERKGNKFGILTKELQYQHVQAYIEILQQRVV